MLLTMAKEAAEREEMKDEAHEVEDEEQENDEDEDLDDEEYTCKHYRL